MYQANMDLGVFQETDITKRMYMCESSGYSVVSMEAPSAHSVSVAIFYRLMGHFSVEVL